MTRRGRWALAAATAVMATGGPALGEVPRLAGEPVAVVGGPNEAARARIGDVALDSRGNVVLLDPGNRRVQRIAPDGTLLAQWRVALPGRWPYSMTLDAADRVYVGGEETPLVRRFRPDGTPDGALVSRDDGFGYVSAVDIAPDGTVYALGDSPALVAAFSPEGARLRTLTPPTPSLLLGGLAVLPDGRVFYSDGVFSRYLRSFSAAGTFLADVPVQATVVAAGADGNLYLPAGADIRVVRPDATPVRTIPTGFPSGDAVGPLDVAASGNVVAVDRAAGRAVTFSPAGARLGDVGPVNATDATFFGPAEADAAPDGDAWTLECPDLLKPSSRVTRITGEGRIVTRWVIAAPARDIAAGPGGTVYVSLEDGTMARFRADGTRLPDLPLPAGVNTSLFDVDGQGRIVFQQSGSPMPEMSEIRRVDPATGEVVTLGSIPGFGEFAVRDDGTVFATQAGAHRVRVFPPSGGPVVSWGSGEAATGWEHIAVAPDGRVTLGDYWTGRVEQFTPEGESLGGWGVLGDGPTDLGSALGVTATDRNIFVVDPTHDRVVVLGYRRPEAPPAAPREPSGAPPQSPRPPESAPRIRTPRTPAPVTRGAPIVLRVEVVAGGRLTVRLRDPMGRVVVTRILTVSTGATTIRLPTRTAHGVLPTGAYRLEVAGRTVTVRVRPRR